MRFYHSNGTQFVGFRFYWQCANFINHLQHARVLIFGLQLFRSPFFSKLSSEFSLRLQTLLIHSILHLHFVFILPIFQASLKQACLTFQLDISLGGMHPIQQYSKKPITLHNPFNHLTFLCFIINSLLHLNFTYCHDARCSRY